MGEIKDNIQELTADEVNSFGWLAAKKST